MKNYNYILLTVVILLVLQCQSKKQDPSVKSASEKKIVMSNVLKARVVSAQNQPFINAVASITEGPSDFLEIAALSDSTGYFELPTGGKTGVYTVNVYANNKSHFFKIAMPQTLAIELLKIED